MTSGQKVLIMWLGSEVNFMGLPSFLQSFMNAQNFSF